MNLQFILLVVFVVLAVAVAGFYAYSTTASFNQKIRAQEEMIASMMGRFDNIESLFMRPPMAEVESIFEKPSMKCSGNVCTLEPLPEESEGSKKSISNEELDELAKKELSEMEEEEESNEPKAETSVKKVKTK